MADKKLDPHERPPDFIKNVYRTFRKMSKSELDDARDILDFGRDLDSLDGVAKLQKIPKATVVAACSHIGAPIDVNAFVSEQDGQIYEARDVPGKKMKTGYH